MADVIVTGASRGIGHALALRLAADAGTRDRIVLVARDGGRLAALASEISRHGGRAVALPGDLSSVAGARALGEDLVRLGERGACATLIHNAGVWPSARTLTADALETAFVVNHLAPLALQQPLLAAGRLRRVMVVSAGLIGKGRFDASRTPTGADFSALRTYCTTKLACAVAMREVARAHPAVDFVVLHPGVVRTELGAFGGPVGWLLSRIKRRWESPEVCAARLGRILARDRWSPAGEARWLVEEDEKPWPEAADDASTRREVREATTRYLGEDVTR